MTTMMSFPLKTHHVGVETSNPTHIRSEVNESSWLEVISGIITNPHVFDVVNLRAARLSEYIDSHDHLVFSNFISYITDCRRYDVILR